MESERSRPTLSSITLGSVGNQGARHFRNLVMREWSELVSRAGVCTCMTNKISNMLAVLAVGGLMFVGSAAAQQTADNTSGAGPGVVDPGHPRVNEVNRREARQQKRIGKGVANGTLTSKQATNLEKRETSVQNREKADMAAHNGHLTKAEQRGINRQQNRISRSIKRDKAVTESKK
jgi:hypothetical protein